jgi:hypothetical protein
VTGSSGQLNRALTIRMRNPRHAAALLDCGARIGNILLAPETRSLPAGRDAVLDVALICAAGHGREGATRVPLAAGARTGRGDPLFGYHALDWSAHAGHVHIVSLLANSD